MIARDRHLTRVADAVIEAYGPTGVPSFRYVNDRPCIAARSCARRVQRKIVHCSSQTWNVGILMALSFVTDRCNFCLPHASLCQPLPQPVPTPRHRLSHAVAALHAHHGGGVDRSGLGLPRSAVVSGAALAAASGGMSQPWWWERQQEGA
jgi:hypothetical protein